MLNYVKASKHAHNAAKEQYENDILDTELLEQEADAREAELEILWDLHLDYIILQLLGT